MDIDILKEFIILAETSTFAEAAQRLGCSSAALRSRISAFEDMLGVPLLKRHARGFELTEAGRQLVPEGQALVDFYHSSLEKSRVVADQAYRRLNIAFTGLEMPRPLRKRLMAFSRKYPEVHIHLMSDSEYGLREALLSRQVDIYIDYFEKQPFLEEMDVRLMWHTVPHILVPAGHPVSRRESALLKDFIGENFVLYPRTRSGELREWQTRVREDAGIRSFNYRNESSKEYSKYLISLGKGVMIYPCAGETIPPDTVAVPLADSHLRKLGVYAVSLKEDAPPTVALFLDEDGQDVPQGEEEQA